MSAAPGWHGHLHLAYRLEHGRTVALDRHTGPLRVLQRLYPEGEAICHHVLVHPPGGVVGGDVLAVEAALAPHTHALITTPGATRFYRSAGATAQQSVSVDVADGARLEWLPLEAIAYDASLVRNHLRFVLAPGASMLGWDVLALGLPAADQAFSTGQVEQHIELPGVWLERGVVAAQDRVLLDSPVGLAGQRVMATLWAASGTPWPAAVTETLLDQARELVAASPLAATAGATAPHEQVVVCRAVAERVEPVFQLWQAVRAQWRRTLWALDANPPRVWST